MVWAALKFDEPPILIVDVSKNGVNAETYQQILLTYFERLELRHGERNYHKRPDYWLQQDG